jgi:(R)-2-hydroxyacyl-CoA dehydratese activating ATPase
MAYFMGIDIGSGNSKGIVIKDNELFAGCLVPSGINYRDAAEKLRNELLKTAGIQWADIKYVVATGQGDASVSYSNECIVDMRCCARGVFRHFPEARTVIDIEGQTTQVMRLENKGRITNFTTSEKCASGSGRFIEIISNVLQIPLEDIGPLSLKSKHPVTFTTACAVFGESEAVSRVAEGVPPEDILAGMHRAMAFKIKTMVEKVGLEQSCSICGGGALNSGLVEAVESTLQLSLLVSPQPQMVTALGAALLAQEKFEPRN